VQGDDSDKIGLLAEAMAEMVLSGERRFKVSGYSEKSGARALDRGYVIEDLSGDEVACLPEAGGGRVITRAKRWDILPERHVGGWRLGMWSVPGGEAEACAVPSKVPFRYRLGPFRNRMVVLQFNLFKGVWRARTRRATLAHVTRKGRDLLVVETHRAQAHLHDQAPAFLVLMVMAILTESAIPAAYPMP
jgi:hypothetical protein